MKVSEMSDEDVEGLCAKAQGWIEVTLYDTSHQKLKTVWRKNNDNAPTFAYHPVTPTVEGKAQCLDLMFDVIEKTVSVFTWETGSNNNRLIGVLDNKNPQRAICEAVVVSVYGEEIEL